MLSQEEGKPGDGFSLSGLEGGFLEEWCHLRHHRGGVMVLELLTVGGWLEWESVLPSAAGTIRADSFDYLPPLAPQTNELSISI